MSDTTQKIYLAQSIVEPNYKVKHYKKDNLEFDYLSKSEFKKFVEASEKDGKTISVLGTVDIKKGSNSNQKDILRISSNDCEFNYELFNKPEDLTDKSKWDKKVGMYISVGEDRYIAVSKKLFLIPIIILLGLLGILIGFLLWNRTPDDPSDDSGFHIISGEDIKEPDNENQITEITANMTLPGYSDTILSESKKTLNLINPDDNTVFLAYSIFYEGEEIYTTIDKESGDVQALPTGRMIEVPLYDYFKGVPGEYPISIKINTYDVDTYMACNTGSQDIVITIK